MTITDQQARELIPRLRNAARLHWRGHDPDDLVQETMLCLLKTTSELLQGGENALLNYAWAVLNRVALTVHRKARGTGSSAGKAVVVAIENTAMEDAYKAAPDKDSMRPFERVEATLVLQALRVTNEEWRRIAAGSEYGAGSTAKVRKFRVIQKLRERARA
jgi:DNA-directed RNA polymerase specialized sigma24 family protein